MWQWPTLESIWADVRFALRQLRRSPGFTIAAVLTLALAIGANAVVFGVLNALILRPLNVPQAQSLYAIEHGSDKDQASRIPTISICATATAASTVWRLLPWARQGSTPARTHPASGAMKLAGNYFDALRNSAVSRPLLPRSPMSMARTAPLTSCSVMPIGTAIFRTIAAWWAASFR